MIAFRNLKKWSRNSAVNGINYKFNYGYNELKLEERSGGVFQMFFKTTLGEMSDVEKEIIGLIQKNNQTSKMDIGKNLGITENGVKYHIRKLSEKNILRWVGSPRKGKWQLLEELE
jgi:ATP-dependent DNA helicase RecG